jgi:phosphotriesterase-related protein
MVHTVRGPVPADHLGPTLMHEHVFVVDAEYAWNYYPAEEVADHIAAAAAQLNAAYEAGVRTIVDCTVLGVGRIVPWLREVAALTPINIVLATGVFVTAELPRLFSLRGPGTPFGGPDPMTDLFVADLTRGIGHFDVRAGVLKAVIDQPGLTPAVERVLRAVAAASLATGAPILTHSHAPTRQGLVQQAVLTGCGVDPSRLVIGHSGDTDDLGYLEQLLDGGSYLGLDRFSYREPVGFDQRVATVAKLCRRGYADRIVLSEDSSCFNAWMDAEVVERTAPGSALTFVPRRVVPALRAAGVTAPDIEQMLVRNPLTLLAGG